LLKNNLFIFILIIFVIVIIIPIVISENLFFFSGPKDKDAMMINVYNHKTDEVVSMELTEYLTGVVAAEMPAFFRKEALKAQAVAARSYTLKKLPQFGGNGTSLHSEADISTDFRYDQAWISRNEMKEKWGFLPYFYFWLRISEAVNETKNEVLIYDGELIDAVYHSNSGGSTEYSENIWNKEIPYLISVESPYDREREKNFRHIIKFDISEMNNRLKIDIDQTDIEKIKAEHDSENINLEEKTNQLLKIEKFASGRIEEINIKNENFSGEEIRNKLKLPSTKANIYLKDDNFVFEVYGFGHGVGLSQDGANGFAGNNYDYEKILKHYYHGVELIDYREL